MHFVGHIKIDFPIVCGTIDFVLYSGTSQDQVTYYSSSLLSKCILIVFYFLLFSFHSAQFIIKSAVAVSSDDDSFADCPSSFNNSPYVNKPLLLGDAQRPSHARQSLGMDALVNNMGKFTFDQSIVGAANTTVDVVAEVEEPPLAAELRIAEGEEIREGQSPTVEEVNEEVNLSEPSPTLEAEEDENQSVVNDVEMMSIVMEGGELADYSNVALPEDDGAPFPDSPPPPLTVETTPEVAEANEVKEQNESVTSPVVAEVTIPKDVQFEEESSVMEVDVTQSAVGEGVETESVPEEVKSPEQEVSVVPPEVQPVISPEVKAVIDVKPEVERDFKVPTMLRKSLTSQPSQVVANPFDGMPTGVVDHKQERKSQFPLKVPNLKSLTARV